MQTLEKMTAYPLNDGTWHTLHIERNRKLSVLRIDQQSPVTVPEPSNQGFRTLDLNSPLMIGYNLWRPGPGEVNEGLGFGFGFGFRFGFVFRFGFGFGFGS